MDQDAMVMEQVDAGRRLVAKLGANGFETEVVFWAKPAEEGKWFLYLASRFVDDKGPAEGYRLVYGVMRADPDPWIEPLEVRVLGLDDSLTQAVRSVIKPKPSGSPFAVQHPKPHQGMTRYGGSSLGGMSVDGAIIYPPAA